jgi:hypothetical protein
MWRSAYVLALWVLTPTILWGGEERPIQRPLIQMQPWIRFDLVLGRIMIHPLQGGSWQVRQAAHPDAVEGESIGLQVLLQPRSQITLRYEQVNEHHTLTVEARSRDRISIRYQPRTEVGGPGWRFCQEPNRPLCWEIGEGGDAQRVSANSFWHLYLAEPQATQQHLIPILEHLRADWQLASQSDRVTAALFTEPQEDQPLLMRSHVRGLVARLDAASFAERQRAERELRRLGIGILCFLLEWEREPLSREQQLRLQTVRQHLTPASADTPQRIATWLREDRLAWLAVLNHVEPEKRSLARTRLEQIDLVTIAFDPHATESDRRQQLAALKAASLR